MTIRIGIIGFGHIARHEHAPAIAADPRFRLVAVASRSGDPGVEVPWFAEPAELYQRMRGQLDAVVVATPPHARHAIARGALEAGLAVLLEKPPASTLGEIDNLARLAREQGRSLFAAWHSQHARGVAAAAALLAGAHIAALKISWLEDVQKYHKGQDWIWEPRGFGVFDSGINALSIVTAILPSPVIVRSARLQVPANRQTPIAAHLTFVGDDSEARFDWRLREGEQWSIVAETRDGRRIELLEGGNRLLLNGTEQPVAKQSEYPSIYARFADLIAARGTEVDREPLRIVADALLVAERETVEPFVWTQPA